MFSPAKKLLVIPMLLVFLASGLFQAARCESAPRATFYSYIRALYYAKRVKQVSKYWIKNGYIYQPKILTEVTDGNVCTMKGVGWGSSQGQRLRAKLDVVMIFEEGSWKIQYYTWQGEIAGHY
jgi:hypothetical protein